jgi:peptide chain release factor 1
MTIDDRLAEIERQASEIETELAQPEVASDPTALRRLGRELRRLEPIVNARRELGRVRDELAGARDIRDHDADGDMRGWARDEVARLESLERDLLERLRLLLVPRDPNDDKDVIIEIRAGPGGEEAALFAAELFRMYQRYAERRHWKTELLGTNPTGIGGMREAIFQVHGDGAYSRLKFEGGVHRVQRVPVTESSGRIHTSTATVAVLPEADEVEVQIDEKDLRVDVYRATGPGGQSVNTTDSAVRITHLPTGMVVAIQDEKSQHKNRAKAVAVLRARLLKMEQRKAHEAEADARRSMVGTGERSEKIRTYNYPQDRVTDHRISMDLHNLPQVLAGDLDRLLDALAMADQAARMASFGDGEGPSDSDGRQL